MRWLSAKTLSWSATCLLPVANAILVSKREKQNGSSACSSKATPTKQAHLSLLHTMTTTYLSIMKKLMSLPLLLSSPQIYKNFLKELDEPANQQNLGFMLAENTATEIGDHITTLPYLDIPHVGTDKQDHINTQKVNHAAHPVISSGTHGNLEG